MMIRPVCRFVGALGLIHFSGDPVAIRIHSTRLADMMHRVITLGQGPVGRQRQSYECPRTGARPDRGRRQEPCAHRGYRGASRPYASLREAQDRPGGRRQDPGWRWGLV